MNTLKKLASWKVILPLFLLYLLLALVLFPRYQNQINAAAGQEIIPLDLRITYTPADVQETYSLIGAEGRAIKQAMYRGLDMVYPLVYGLLFTLLILNLLNGIGDKNWGFLLLLPLISMVFDYLENFSMLNFLAQYPDINEPRIHIASYFTSLKWLLRLACALIVAVLGVIRLSSFIQDNKD
ncbi:MAG TPA: hypothetical protein VJ953_01710 [Saprospiraceae bacterium]|nr:hypothetical protein [Saprospiraceae bacterium]